MRKAFVFIMAATAASITPASAQTAEADRAFLERASLRAADETCNLFSEGERLALAAGFWQSRGALLRGGYTVSEVSALASEAGDYAAQRGCEDPSLMSSAARLRDAFIAFSRTPFIEYFGDHGSWTASRADTDDWAAVQARSDGFRIGLFNDEDSAAPRPAAYLPLDEGAPAPVSARLFTRDPLKSPRPWLGGLFGSTEGLIRAPLSISEGFWASERRPIEAGRGAPAGAVFLFPAEVQARFNELDPREAVWVEFTPSPRLRNAAPQRALFEVGDFRAAAAFAAIPRADAEAAATIASVGIADSAAP